MNMKILYVDDERDLLELAATFFEEEGLALDTAHEFEQAFELIRKNDYDLIISDIRMPTGSGIDLVERARAGNHFDGRLILVSGDIKSQEEGKRVGSDRMINKPIDFFELIDLARELLKNK